MLGRESEINSSQYVEGIDMETVVPLTIDQDTCLFSKSIR